MKISKFFSIATIAALFFTSCGKGTMEKGSLEARTASIIESNANIPVFGKMNIDNLITKAGIFDGAIPMQYASMIKIYKESVFNALNMEKSVHVLLEGPIDNDGPKSIFVLFEVKDMAKLKKELTDVGGKGTEKDGIYFLAQDNMAIGIQDKFGILRVTPKGETSFDDMKKIIASSNKEVKNEKLATILNATDDISIGGDLERFFIMAAKHSQMSGVSLDEYTKKCKGSYIHNTANFENGKATLTCTPLFEKDMSEFFFLNEQGASNEALHSIGNEKAIFALALNLNYEKLFNFFYKALPKEQKAQTDQALALAGGPDNVSKMFTGEMAFVMAGDNSETFEPKINAYLGLNKASYLKTLISGFGGMIGLKNNGDDVYTTESITLKLTDKKLVFTSNNPSFAKAVEGKSEGIQVPEGFNFGSTPVSAFINFTQIDTTDIDADALKFVRALNYATIEGSNEKFTLTLVSRNNKDNILKEAVSIAVKGIVENLTRGNDDYEDVEEDYSDSTLIDNNN